MIYIYAFSWKDRVRLVLLIIKDKRDKTSHTLVYCTVTEKIKTKYTAHD